MEKKPVPVSPAHWSPLAAVTFVWNNMALPGLFSRPLLAGAADPYLTFTVAEFDGEGTMNRADAYEQAKAYLGDLCARRARELLAGAAAGGDRVVLGLGDGAVVADEFRGATVWWTSSVLPAPRRDQKDAGRAFRLSFHQRHCDLVAGEYLPHVCCEGGAIMAANRRRKLFTSDKGLGYDLRSAWRHVALEHPSTFETLAMDPAKKKEIMDDLDAFRGGKEYYTSVGKAWRRVYLLYGPPGTGKSSMIAAMANHLYYDIYDIKLTAVSTNTDLRRMLIETTGKSIIVIEDIDCSLDLTGKRHGATKATVTNKTKKKSDDGSQKTERKLTLSGVLNFINGLWSACSGERIIVFTANHVEKLDPALIRSRRIDKHIEMSYCCSVQEDEEVVED